LPNSNENKAVLRFIEDSLAKTHSGELDDETALGSIAIVLSAWTARHPEVARHLYRQK
jgi:hypothetical protein